ncbi:site-specific integrase [Paenibacillus aquistagni]|uniref:site-specific integrase n=1 Tax=Paenibacillus aquistagni TaxID=1852522 RepID=UPI00145B83DF|nr:site-specific integrase [Paenibacillus aquistagni]NMM52034.1 site-specific integrase [Paenibacillus aquistagni]
MANIQQRGPNSWFFTIYTGRGPDGKYGRKTKTLTITDQALLKTKKKLQDYIDDEYAKFRQEVQAGEYIAPEKMTFGDFIEDWREKYGVKHLGERTLYAYDSTINKHLLPVFGHMRLDQIKTIHIINYLDTLNKGGARKDKKEGSLSSGTIQYHHRVLKNVFTRAVEWKFIKNNPVSDVRKPKVQYKEVVPYDEDEVSQLMLALQNEPFHWRMMITLALTTGLRRGELLGLEWKHVNWKTGIIEVVQSVTKSVDGLANLKEPKNNKRRKVSLPSSILEEFKNYYTSRVRERDKIGDAWKGGDHFFVFSHPNGKAFNQERPYIWFKKFTQRNGFRHIRFHDLRHTSATLLINQGVHAKIISERLGHSNITTTMNIYGHALQTADQMAAEKLNNLFTISAKTDDKKTHG